MLLKRRGFLFVVLFLFSLAGVLAASVSMSGNSASISNAVDLYAYEIKMTYTGGTPTGATFDGFLGAGTSSGTNTRGDYFYVYESKLDNTQIGVSGSGDLFDVTTSGTTTLYSVLLIDSEGGETTLTYYCGDGTCDSGIGETTSTCSADCPSTGGTTSGGGGGSGGSTTQTLLPAGLASDFTISQNKLNINVVLEETAERTITITNRGSQAAELKVVLEGFDGFAFVSPVSFTLSPWQQKNVVLKIEAGEKGLIAGKIVFVSGENIVGETTVIVNVMSENFLFDSTISLPRQYRTISVGETISAQIDLQQVGPQEKVDVVANYIIKDFSGNNYLEDSETFYVLGEKTFTKEFYTADLPPGKYVLALEIVYPGAFATSSVQFEVLQKESAVSSFFDKNLGIIIFLTVTILFVLIAVVLVVRRVKKGRAVSKI